MLILLFVHYVMHDNRDYKIDGIESAYLSFYPKEKDFHSILSRDAKISITFKKYIELLSIPYKEEGDVVIINSLQLIKLIFILEIAKFIKSPKQLIYYADIFDKKYITNAKDSMYAYLLEFYITYMRSGKNVNIYVTSNDIHIMADLEFHSLSILFGDIGTHTIVNLADIVEKIYNKRVDVKYKKMFLNTEEEKVFLEVFGKDVNYTKKSIILDFDATESLKSIDVKGIAPIEKYHEIDKDLAFGGVTKVKYNGKATHLAVNKKISLKKKDKNT